MGDAWLRPFELAVGRVLPGAPPFGRTPLLFDVARNRWPNQGSLAGDVLMDIPGSQSRIG